MLEFIIVPLLLYGIEYPEMEIYCNVIMIITFGFLLYLSLDKKNAYYMIYIISNTIFITILTIIKVSKTPYHVEFAVGIHVLKMIVDFANHDSIYGRSSNSDLTEIIVE